MSVLFAAGISFKTAPVALREQLAVAPADRAVAARRLQAEAGLAEAVLLWTCNRVEVYGASAAAEVDAAALFRLLAGPTLALDGHLYCHTGAAALQHLFAVTSGLDSMVLGETEIAGQVKDAYEAAHAAGLTGRLTNLAFQKALSTSKEIRTRTSIGRGATSVGSVCVEHAERILGPGFAGRRVMVIGAGKMAETCVKHLAKQGVRSVIVANRSMDRAVELAGQFGGSAVHFDRCQEAMADVDIVITSTGCPVAILYRPDIEAVMRQREDRPLFLIDIAVPRDVDPGVRGLPNVHLYDIDDLQDTVQHNMQHRAQDLTLCREIMERSATVLLDKMQGRRENLHEVVR